MTAPDGTGTPGSSGAQTTPVPLPHGIALAALESIRQAYEPGTMAHDTALRAIEDTAAASAANDAADVNHLPVTPAAAALYRLCSAWTREAFRTPRLLDEKDPRATALDDCSAALRAAVNDLRLDGAL